MFTNSPRCQILPLPNDQVAFSIDGVERLRWHAGSGAPRPFFFPLIGPSGLPLTRMGHPGAPNHDHHRSIWFAHHKVLGVDFWSNSATSFIRQDAWLAYEDGEEEARMAVNLKWYDGHDPQPLLNQQMICVISPDGNSGASDNQGVLLEIQTSLTSVAESLELGQTNFGLLAVRVAKSISAYFGDGILTDANGKQGEKALFGQRSPWIDYSGSIAPGVTEGITYFDHPSNLTFPNKWHVRDDGWMNASVSRDAPVMLTRDEPTTWRFLLHAHRGGYDHARAKNTADDFRDRQPLEVVGSSKPHIHAAIRRT